MSPFTHDSGSFYNFISNNKNYVFANNIIKQYTYIRLNIDFYTLKFSEIISALEYLCNKKSIRLFKK